MNEIDRLYWATISCQEFQFMLDYDRPRFHAYMNYLREQKRHRMRMTEGYRLLESVLKLSLDRHDPGLIGEALQGRLEVLKMMEMVK